MKNQSNVIAMRYYVLNGDKILSESQLRRIKLEPYDIIAPIDATYVKLARLIIQDDPQLRQRDAVKNKG